MPSLEQLTNELKDAFESKNYEKVEELMTPIKILLISNDLLLPNFVKLSGAEYVNDLIISRSILEIAAFSYINLSKFDKFQQILDSLKVYYFNDVSKELVKSTKKTKLLSLYLLLLLSSGDFVKFYTELEYYNHKLSTLETDLYLKYPIKLANWLLEGYYDKVLSVLLNNDSELIESKSKLKEFQIFDDTLIQITRLEISKTLSKSYKSLDLKNTKNLLYLRDNDNERLQEFIQEFGWKLQNNELIFNEEEQEEGNEEVGLSVSEKLIKNTLSYAREIDSII